MNIDIDDELVNQIKSNTIINKLGKLSVGKSIKLVLKKLDNNSKETDYAYFFWWRLVFSEKIRNSLKSDLKKYEGIHFMPYVVNNELLSEINKHTGTAFPNIDCLSGNIHPKWGKEEVKRWLNNPTIKQIVLVKSNQDEKGKAHWGPLKEKELNTMSNITPEEIAPNDCFFPFRNSTMKENENHSIDELIKGFLKQILDKHSSLYKELFEE